MNDLHHSTTPLHEISLFHGGHNLVASELSTRFQDGRAHEVADYLAQCDFSALVWLGMGNRRRNIWDTDPGAWRAFARLTAKRGILWLGADAMEHRDAAFSAEMHAFGRDLLASAGTDPAALVSAWDFILNFVTPRLGYPGIARADVLAMVDEHLAIRSAARLTDAPEHDSWLHPLLACLDDPAHLVALAGRSEYLFRQAMRAHQSRSEHERARERWRPWHDFFDRHPDYLACYLDRIADPGLMLRRWPSGAAQLRRAMMHSLLGAMPWPGGDDQDYAAEVLDAMIRDDDDKLFQTISQPRHRLGLAIALVSRQQSHDVLLELFPRIVAQYHAPNAGGALNIVLAAHPELFAGIFTGDLPAALALLSNDVLRAVLPALGERIGQAACPRLRAAAVTASARLDLADLGAAGWFTSEQENLRLACREILLTHPDQAGATALLAAH